MTENSVVFDGLVVENDIESLATEMMTVVVAVVV